MLQIGKQRIRLTNLDKLFWPEDGIRKRDLLQYYLAVAPYLLPHLRDRPMVLRRHPGGAADPGFFMKNAPELRPPWVETHPIRHERRVINFVLVQDLATLLWVVNLGCIDLNPWYARRDAPEQPDFLMLDLDPGVEAPFAAVCEGALVLRDALASLGMTAYAKTTGSRGIHVAVAIRRGPTQDRVWQFAKALAHELASRHRTLFTVEYSKARRPANRVLLDYNQMAYGQTLASIYSVRPRPRAPVSTPLTWAEIGRGVAIEDYRFDNVPARLARRGDLWRPLLSPRGRFDLGRLV
ncbi:MAG TPA: non-homologous end-joining DNA ligase [Candidatus Limnocylindria bacterium]|nr:non-homologous end-joining DNA ligase [Candidatus Limnocylindria bacterium]